LLWELRLLFSLSSTVHAHEPPFAWTGLYLGANVGWGRATADVDVSTAERTRVFRAFGQPAQALISDVTVPAPGATASGTADVNGWLGGVHRGYNWQSQRWVYGVEADLQWTGQDGDVAACLGAACAKGQLSA
jgi:outer membrane immunogenic protein